MLHELQGEVLVARVDGGQFDRQLQHVLTEQSHPCRAVCLFQLSPGREGCAPVEDPDVVEAQKTPLEEVPTRRVLTVHPPGEVEEQLLEGVAEKVDVASPVLVGRGVVGEKRGPRVHRRVDVTEVPFIGRDLAVRVKVDVREHQLYLIAGERRGRPC